MSDKIILLNNNPPTTGVGNYAYSLSRHFTKLGRSDIIFTSWSKQLFDRTYHTLRPFRLHWPYYMTKLKVLASQLRINNSLIHVANAGYLAFLIPKLKQNANIIVITVHALVPFIAPRSISDVILRKTFLNITEAKRIITVSESAKRDLLHFLDINPNLIKVIYNGVDHEVFKPRSKKLARKRLNLPRDKKIILNVGSEELRKNIPVLIKAFYELLKEMSDVILIRIGERTSRIQRLIKTLGISNRVLYFKSLSLKEIAHFYNAADVLVHPSCYEGFGLPLLEAMASGIPGITSNRSSIPEVIGDAGILLDPFDIDSFAYWMREVLTNEYLRDRLSKVGYKKSLNFGWRRCARETLEVYEEISGDV